MLFTQINTLYCWGLFPDPASPGDYFCLTDNNMDRPPPPHRYSRKARADRVARLLSAGPRSIAEPATRAPGLTRLCSLYRIAAATGASALIGSFPAGEEEDVASGFDAATGVVWAVRRMRLPIHGRAAANVLRCGPLQLLSDETTNACTLYGLNATSGKLVVAAPFADGSNIICASRMWGQRQSPHASPIFLPPLPFSDTMDFDAATGRILTMASTYDFAAGQWNTFFGTLAVSASDQVELTPIGPLNGTFAAYRQFNDIRSFDSESGACTC